MQCPRCKRESARRSRRRGLHEYLFSLAGVYPWRCRDCERRFFATLVPLRHVFYAHCPRCGNFDLERVSGEVLARRSGFAGRLLLGSPLRCDPCRLNFVTLRPLRASPADASPMGTGSAQSGGEKALGGKASP